jgi:hypothetical protein
MPSSVTVVTTIIAVAADHDDDDAVTILFAGHLPHDFQGLYSLGLSDGSTCHDRIAHHP